MKLLREALEHRILINEVDAQLKKVQLQALAVIQVADRMLQEREKTE